MVERYGEQRGFVGTERYVLERPLGSGGMGAVYQVFDRQREARVALKTLTLARPDVLARFKTEFRALADVVHPNLVTLYDLEYDGRHWFITMELVQGREVLDFLRPVSLVSTSAVPPSPVAFEPTLPSAPRILAEPTIPGPPPAGLDDDTLIPPPESAAVEDGTESTRQMPVIPRPTRLDLQQLRRIFEQLARGLSYLHGAGKLHCDIKPSNVLVTEEGRVVVLDFGLVTELARGGKSRTGSLAGTPAYMAPEQAAARPLDEAADWYAVGVMLYQAITQIRPFTGNPAKILRDKQLMDPRPPSSVAPGIPPELDRLVMALLHRDPARRATGEDVLRWAATGQFDETSGASGASREVPFVGRSAQLGVLADGLERVRAGGAATVMVHGRSGMGKSALVAHFLEQARAGGAIVLEGRCYERESMPYKALDSLVDGLTQHLLSLSPVDAAQTIPADGAALARVFPVLRQLRAIDMESLDPSVAPQELRRRATVALRECLRRLAATAPLVVHIDDLQWGDVDSAPFLVDLLRPPDPPPLLMLFAFRTEEAKQSALIQALRGSEARFWGGGEAAAELELGPLTHPEARDLAAAVLGDAGSATSILVERIARESRGSPFFVELLGLTLARAPAEPTEPVALSLDDVIWSRVLGLSSDARRLLEVAAVAGRPITASVARHAADVTGDELAAIAVLKAQRMLRTTGGKQATAIEPYHDRVRETVVVHLAPESLRRCHLGLARALEATPDVEPETLALHLRGGGDDARARTFAVLAADKASQALAFDRAATFYRMALELSPPAGEVLSLQVRLADALANAGRGAEAAEAFEAAARGSEGLDALELERRAVHQYMIAGRLEEGVAAMRALVEKVGLRLAPSTGAALANTALLRTWIALRGSLRYQERAVSEIAPRELTTIDICYTVSQGLGMVDPMRSADFQARGWLRALKAGEPRRIAIWLSGEAATTALRGAPAEAAARKLLVAMQALKDRLGDPVLEGVYAFTVASCDFLVGRWKPSCVEYERSEEILRTRVREYSWELATAPGYIAVNLFFLGRLRELLRRMPADLASIRERGDRWGQAFLQMGMPNTFWLIADDVEGARGACAEAEASIPKDGFTIQHGWMHHARANIALYAGEAESGWQFVQRDWKAMEKSGLFYVQYTLVEMVHVRARLALLAAARGVDATAALASAKKDARRLRAQKLPWAQAASRLVMAGVERLSGRPERAVALLSEAEAILEAADMALYLEAARWRRGALIGGEEGAALVDQARAAFGLERVRRPERFLDVLAPGFEA